jgi:hypothetical protein
MWTAIVIILLVLFAIKPSRKRKCSTTAKPTRSRALQQANRHPLGQSAADIEGAWASGDWDWARAALQKLAYTMTGDDVSQEQKDHFKRLMTRFAQKDPLYREIIVELLPVIQQQPGILQSEIYAHVPRHDVETIRYVLYFAHELGDLVRLKKGRSYQLFGPGQATSEPKQKAGKKPIKTKEELHTVLVQYAEQRLTQLRDPDLLKLRPYWKYISNETMIVPCHQEWDGLVLRHDDPWWDKHFPPNGPDCRCRVTAVAAEEYMGQIAPLD